MMKFLNPHGPSPAFHHPAFGGIFDEPMSDIYFKTRTQQEEEFTKQ